jgi:hypothetical protein
MTDFGAISELLNKYFAWLNFPRITSSPLNKYSLLNRFTFLVNDVNANKHFFATVSSFFSNANEVAFKSTDTALNSSAAIS